MTVEIIAIVSSRYEIQTLIEIADALLAAPILAVEVALDSANAYAAICELRNRAGSHMCVAARDVQTHEQATRATTVDAQYLVCTSLDAAAQIDVPESPQSLNIPCIPTISEINDLMPNMAAFNRVRFRPTGAITASQVQSLCNALPNTQVFIDLPASTHGEIKNQIAGFVQAGVSGIAVGQAIVSGAEPSLADIITKARVLTASWKIAKARI